MFESLIRKVIHTKFFKFFKIFIPYNRENSLFEAKSYGFNDKFVSFFENGVTVRVTLTTYYNENLKKEKNRYLFKYYFKNKFIYQNYDEYYFSLKHTPLFSSENIYKTIEQIKEIFSEDPEYMDEDAEIPFKISFFNVFEDFKSWRVSADDYFSVKKAQFPFCGFLNLQDRVYKIEKHIYYNLSSTRGDFSISSYLCNKGNVDENKVIEIEKMLSNMDIKIMTLKNIEDTENCFMIYYTKEGIKSYEIIEKEFVIYSFGSSRVKSLSSRNGKYFHIKGEYLGIFSRNEDILQFLHSNIREQMKKFPSSDFIKRIAELGFDISNGKLTDEDLQMIEILEY